MSIPLTLHLMFILLALTGAMAAGVLAGRAWSMKVAEKVDRQTSMSSEEWGGDGNKASLMSGTVDAVALVPSESEVQQAMTDIRTLLPVIRANVNDVVQETEQAALSIGNALNHLDDLTSKTPGLATTSTRWIHEGIRSLQFQDITRQKLENILSVLQRLDAILSGEAVAGNSPQSSLIAEAKRKYTTAGERNNHKSLLAEPKSGEGDRELGDNVELF